MQSFIGQALYVVIHWPGPVAQSGASLIADPGAVSLTQARPHTFLEIDREIFSTVILLFPLTKKGCQSMCMEYWLTTCLYNKLAQEMCG